MKTQRYRIKFSKTKAMRYTGHLDLILTWERTFRRAGLPLSYSEGFNPRPVINLASPLPLGFTSSAELGDFWLSERVAPDEFEQSLQRALPPGIEIIAIDELEELFGPKLPSQVTASTYLIDLENTDPVLPQKISRVLEAKSIPRTKRAKEYDLRPLIMDINLVENTSSEQVLEVTLVTEPNKTGRPDEVLLTLDLKPEQAFIERTTIHLRSGAGR